MSDLVGHRSSPYWTAGAFDITLSELAIGDVVTLQNPDSFTARPPYHATVVEHSMETPGGVWVETDTHRLLLGPDGRILVSSRRLPYAPPRWEDRF